MISLKILIEDRQQDTLVARVLKKEAFTLPDPRVGQTYVFHGAVDEKYQVGSELIVRADFQSPDNRIDSSKIEMSIMSVSNPHFDPFGVDLDIVFYVITVVFFGIAFLTFLRKRRHKKSRG